MPTDTSPPRAATAARASDRQSRVREFGMLLELCASCHARHTTLWESAR